MMVIVRRLVSLVLILCCLLLSSSCAFYQSAYDEGYIRALGVYAYRATGYASADFHLKEEVYEIKDGVFTVTGYMGMAYAPDPDEYKDPLGYFEVYTDRRDCLVNGVKVHYGYINDLLTNDIYRGQTFKVRTNIKESNFLKHYKLEYVDILLPVQRTELLLEFTPGKRSGVLHIDAEIHETSHGRGPNLYFEVYYALNEQYLVFSTESRYDAEKRLKEIGD